MNTTLTEMQETRTKAGGRKYVLDCLQQAALRLYDAEATLGSMNIRQMPIGTADMASDALDRINEAAKFVQEAMESDWWG